VVLWLRLNAFTAVTWDSVPSWGTKISQAMWLSKKKKDKTTVFHQIKSLKCQLPGLPWWHSRWESACRWRGHGINPWSGTIPQAAEQLSPCAATTEACVLRAGAPQEKPL